MDLKETQCAQVTAVGPSETYVTVNINREEDTKTVIKSAIALAYYEDFNSKPRGRLKSDTSRLKTRKRILRIAKFGM